MAKSKTYPGFFVVHIPKLTSQRLLIPTTFIACIDKVLPNKAILRNRHGRLWQVEVVKTDNGVYFWNGWANFVEDNSLELGEFIVFRYNGDYIFYVNFFGRSGCEKKDTMTSASIDKKISFININEEEEEEEERKCCEKQKEKVIEEEDGDDNCYTENDADDDDDDEEEEEEDDDDDDDDDNYVVEEEEEEEDEDDVGDKEDETGCRKKGGSKVTDDNILGQNEETQPVKAKNCDGIDVEKYVNPANPYFVSRLLANRAKLYVPTDVIEDFNIQLHPKMKMVFRDPMGTEWPGEVVVWKDGRVWIGGWKKLYKRNKVTKDDKCICELILDKGNLIKVHIVRAGQT